MWNGSTVQRNGNLVDLEKCFKKCAYSHHKQFKTLKKKYKTFSKNAACWDGHSEVRMYIDSHICPFFLFRCVEIFFFSLSLAGLNVPSSHVAARGVSSRILLRSLSLAIAAVDTAENEPERKLDN